MAPSPSTEAASDRAPRGVPTGLTNKIQCFCFTAEKLEPGESAEMPVEFYLDKSYATDPDANLFSDLTLSYTFYPQDKMTPQEANEARDLGNGSQIEGASIKQGDALKFDNNAPQR